ncbi:MAG: hypothetical protein ACPL25_11580 [Ignavibacteria bacterium]
MNEQKKFRFNYEDVVDYVLGKMDEEKIEAFENELKTSDELQILYSYVKSKEDEIKKIHEWKFPDEFMDTVFELIKNINSNHKKFEIGDIYKLDTQLLSLSRIEKKLLENLYFVIVKSPKGSLTGKDVRVIPLSRFIHYSQPYDLLLTEKLISTREFGVVAHIHLATNLLTDWLDPFIGKMSTNNLNAIMKADYNDYSLVDERTIKRGGLDDELARNYWFEEFDVWNDIVRSALNKLQSYIMEISLNDRVIIQKDESQEFAEIEPIYNMREIRVAFSKLSSKAQEEEFYRKEEFYRSKLKSPTRKVLAIDKDGFIIISSSIKVMERLLGNLPSKTEKQKAIVTFTEEFENKSIKNLSKINYKSYLKRILVDFKARVYKSSDFEVPQEMLRYAAKSYELTKILPDQPLTLYDGLEFQLFLNSYGDDVFLEILFLDKDVDKIKEIKDFYLLNLEDRFGIMIEKIPVKDNIARIPMNFPTELLMGFISGCEIGFIFNYKIVNLKLKIVFN